MTATCGTSPNAGEILQRTRLALMTPDVIQQWLMAYSEPLYHRRPLRHDLREVQNTQYNVRRFLSNLALLILDEAHTYDGALGTHCLYLLHRLQQKRRELMAQFEPLRVIAASATIHNPAQHLETLTGLPFQVVDDRYDGSPRAELTVQHVIGREPRDEGWRDLQAAVREVISDHPHRSYIAFVDDRQLAERAAAGIEAARSITEDAIIVESRDAMAYRSGLMRRERIEEALRSGDIRGLASTSAMEMGIDIPDLEVGFNLGLPHSVGRIRQRAGRVGRTGPGRFIIMAPRHAFQFHEDRLETYWRQPVEPARLYPSNPNIRNTHGRCLARETDLNGMERSLPSPTDAWPEQLPPTLREIARGDHYAPEFQTGDPQQPHRNDIRDAADGRARIVQVMPGGETELLTSEVTRREAARDAYPLATYFHAKQSYSILSWRESGGETVITARHAPPRETRPITRSGATVIGDNCWIGRTTNRATFISPGRPGCGRPAARRLMPPSAWFSDWRMKPLTGVCPRIHAVAHAAEQYLLRNSTDGGSLPGAPQPVAHRLEPDSPRGGLPGSSSRSDIDGVLILSDPQGMTANIVVEANPRPVEARRVSVLADRWARQLHPRRGRGPALPGRSRRQQHRRPRPRRHGSGGEHPHRHTGRRPLAGGLLPMAPAAPDVGTPAAGNRRN